MITPNERFLGLFKDLNLSIPEFAKECGIDSKVRTIYKIIKDSHKPSIAIIREVNLVFPQFSIEYILYGNDKKDHNAAEMQQKNVLLNTSITEQKSSFEEKEQNMISGFIKLENELVRTSNALQTTLLNCTNQIQEMVIQNAKTKNDFEAHVLELNKQLGALSDSNLRLSNQIIKVEAKVQEMHHDNTMVAIQAKEYIEESQASHKRNRAFQQQIIPDLREFRKTKKKS